jgi:hypothetical protein
MPTVGQPGSEGHLITVRGLLIMIVTAVTAGSAGIAAGFVTAAKVAPGGTTTATVVAVATAAGLAAALTTAIAVASGLHKLIKSE